MEQSKTLGIIGAGRMGQAMGRLAADADWHVLFTDVRSSGELSNAIASVADDARLVSLDELVRASDIIILALPFAQSKQLDYQLFTDKIVVDPMNYWPATDGELPELAGFTGSTTELVQQRNPKMRLVKTLNHQAYLDLTTDPRSKAAADRRALAVCSNDAVARSEVCVLVDDMGFDPVPASMNKAKQLDDGGVAFGRRMLAAQMREALGV